jgi:hypothetical protein
MGGSQHAIRIHHFSVIQALASNGPFTQQAFMSNEAPVKSVCMAAFMNNTGSGGLWSLPGDLSGLTLIQCNNP